MSSKQHILILDSESSAAEQNRAPLVRSGYEVTVVETAAEAEQVARGAWRVDLLLCEVFLGATGGAGGGGTGAGGTRAGGGGTRAGTGGGASKGTGASGTTAARRVLSIRNVPVVFTSARTDRAALEEVRGVPHAGFVVKGTGEHVLLDAVTTAIERRAHTYVDNAPYGIFIADAEGRYTDVNPAASETTGYSRAELLEKNLIDLIPPDHHERVREAFEEIHRRGYGSTDVAFETKQGERRYWNVKTVKLADGSYMGFTQDITELERTRTRLEDSEKRYRSLVENSPLGIAEFDEDGRFLLANSVIARNFGMSKEELIGRCLGELVPPEVYAKRKEIAEQAVRENRAIRFEDERAGRVFHNTIVPNYSGDRPTVQVVSRDVTRQRENEKEVKRQREEAVSLAQAAEEASRAKSQFLANMSHEVRTPLNSVIGFTDLLLRSELDARQLEYVQHISTSAEALKSVVDDILDISRIEEGRLELHQSETDLHEVVEESMQLARRTAEHKKLPLRLELEDSVPRRVWTDPIRLRQVLLNLLSNAVKFTDQGHVLLRVSHGGRRGNRALLEFSVSDTGIGIEQENLARLFDVFSQADPSSTRRHGGTGLGLAITSRILELMESCLDVRSAPGEGSTFSFELSLEVLGETGRRPVLASEEFTGPAGELPEVETPETPPADTPRKRVLIAEDNPVNLKLAATLVGRTLVGAEILHAKDGARAVALYRREQPDLVFMDLQMPQKDGFEATREIRSLPEDRRTPVPIVALTAWAEEGQRERCLEAGMNDFLSKPITEDDIAEVLRRWLAAPAT